MEPTTPKVMYRDLDRSPPRVVTKPKKNLGFRIPFDSNNGWKKGIPAPNMQYTPLVQYRLQNVAPDSNENIFDIIDNFCNKYNQIPIIPDLLELEAPELVTM